MKDPVEARVKFNIREKKVNDLYRCSFVYETTTQMEQLLDKLMHLESGGGETTVQEKVLAASDRATAPAGKGTLPPLCPVEFPPPIHFGELGELLERCKLGEHLKAFEAAQVDLETLSAFSPEGLDAALKEIGLCLGARVRFTKLLQDKRKGEAAAAKKKEKKDEQARLTAKEEAEEKEEDMERDIIAKAREESWVVIKVDTNVNDSTHPQLVKLYIQIKIADDGEREERVMKEIIESFEPAGGGGGSCGGGLCEGAKVKADYKRKGKMLSGKITRDHGDGTFDIEYGRYAALEIAIISREGHAIMHEPHECEVEPHAPYDEDEPRSWWPFARGGPEDTTRDVQKYMVTIHDLYKVVRLTHIPNPKTNIPELQTLLAAGGYVL